MRTKPRAWKQAALRRGALLAAGLLLGGCAASRAPIGYLATPAAEQVDGRGAWIRVQPWAGSRLSGSGRVVEGELLAVDADSLHVLVADGRVAGLDWRGVRRARLEGWRSDAPRLARWTVAGSLLPVTTLFLAPFTLPIWLVTGTIATIDLSRRPLVACPPADWRALAPHARFPQGLPPGLDIAGLHLRPAASAEGLRVQPVAILPDDRWPATAARPVHREQWGPAGLAGAWLTGRVRLGGSGLRRTRTVAGEFIALDAESLWINTGRLRAMARRDLVDLHVRAVAEHGGLLHEVGRIGPTRGGAAGRFARFPAGLPAGWPAGRDLLARQLAEDLAARPAAAAYLERWGRWPPELGGQAR